jgi:hypothetical protein
MKRTFLLALLLSATTIFAQSNVSLRFMGLTVHPGGDPTAELQPYKLDKDAWLVLNFGGVFSYEKFIWQDFMSFNGVQAFFADCSAGFASVSHVGIRGYFLKTKRHRMGFQLGSAFMVREDWSRLEGYESSGRLKSYDSKLFGPVQYRFFPIAMMLEYDCKLNKHWDLTAGITPGPFAFTSAVGVKYWFNRDFKEKLYLPRIKD